MNFRYSLLVFLIVLTGVGPDASWSEEADAIERILVFGASGRIGKHIVDEGL